MIDGQTCLEQARMTNISSDGQSAISRALDGLDSNRESTTATGSGGDDGSPTQGQAPVTGVLAGLSGRVICDGLGPGGDSQSAPAPGTGAPTRSAGQSIHDVLGSASPNEGERDEPGVVHGNTSSTSGLSVRLNALLGPGRENGPGQLTTSPPVKAADSGPMPHSLDTSGTIADVGRLTTGDLMQARIKIGAGLWTFDEAVAYLGAHHKEDREALSKIASLSAQFADDAPVPSKPNDSSPAPPDTTSPAQQTVSELDAAPIAGSPIAEALSRLDLCLGDFTKTQASVNVAHSHQFGGEGLSESLDEAIQHFEDVKDHANEAFGILTTAAATLPVSDFGKAVHDCQYTFFG